MGNDKQIKDLLEKTKSVFLPESIQNPDGKPKLYSLDDEFHKTRKNKPFLLYLFVSGFVVLIAVVSIIMISYIQNKNKKITLEFNEFEDVKLKELIESSRNHENNIEQIRREMSELESDYQDSLDKINKEFSRLQEELNLRDLSSQEKSTQLSILDANKKNKIRKVESEYLAKRNTKEKEISEIQKKIRSAGTSMSSASKKLEDIFGGEGKLQNLQLRKVSSQYEDKLKEIKDEDRKEQDEIVLLYNPIFKEKYVLEVIQNPVIDVKAKDKYFASISDDIAIENAATKDQIAKLSDDMKKELAITGRLKQIPYRNSVQRSVFHADSLAKQIFNNYDTILQKLVASIQGKNQALSQYRYALEYMTKSQQENGYILDGRDKNKIGVYLSKVHAITPGDVAYVFRSDDEYIATIKFKTSHGLIVGELVELVPGREIRPFDKLMFKMESEQQ